MFIAMNRFKVLKSRTEAFEDAWRRRESHLPEMQGFVAFHLLKGPERDDHILYASHTIWKTKENFTAWTISPQFRAAHRNADPDEPKTLGHPEFEGFDVVQTLDSRQ